MNSGIDDWGRMHGRPVGCNPTLTADMAAGKAANGITPRAFLHQGNEERPPRAPSGDSTVCLRRVRSRDQPVTREEKKRKQTLARRGWRRGKTLNASIWNLNGGTRET